MRASEVIMVKMAEMAKEAKFGTETAKRGVDAVKRGYKGYISAIKGTGAKDVGEKIRQLNIQRDYGMNPQAYAEQFGPLAKSLRGEKLKTLLTRGGTGAAGLAGVGGVAVNVISGDEPVRKSAGFGSRLIAGSLVPGIIGAGRASNLAPEEVAELREYYGLKSKKGIKSRAFWKSMVMGAAGNAGGRALGAPFGRRGAMLGSAVGGAAGTIYGSNKYSRGNLQKIRAEKTGQQ